VIALACVLGYGASCAGLTMPSGDTRVASGVWGGEHLGVTVTSSGAQLEFDCAHGNIDQPLTVDEAGKLAIVGTFVREHGGPIRSDEKEDKRRTLYSGQLKGDTLTITVTLVESNEQVGTFTVTRGAEPIVRKCL